MNRDTTMGGAFGARYDHIRCRLGDQRRVKHPDQLIRQILGVLQNSYELRRYERVNGTFRGNFLCQVHSSKHTSDMKYASMVLEHCVHFYLFTRTITTCLRLHCVVGATNSRRYTEYCTWLIA
jgi:hypothetical protein